LSTEITDDRNYEWFGGFLLRPMGGVSLIMAVMALATALACRDLELSVRFVLRIEAPFLLLNFLSAFSVSFCRHHGARPVMNLHLLNLHLPTSRATR
jgi:hypothetical protein